MGNHRTFHVCPIRSGSLTLIFISSGGVCVGDAEVPLHGRGHSVATGGHFSMLVATVLSHLSSATSWCSSQLYILCSYPGSATFTHLSVRVSMKLWGHSKCWKTGTGSLWRERPEIVSHFCHYRLEIVLLATFSGPTSPKGVPLFLNLQT